MKIMPEDLMQTVIAADAIRRRRLGERRMRFARWKRLWIEPFFNFIGLAISQVLALLPWPLHWRAILLINRGMRGSRSALPATFESSREEVAAMVRRLHDQTGQWPSVMIWTSHPNTVGELEWLRFEVVRHGLRLANRAIETAQRGKLYRSNPECFLAIDPYALDTLPTAVAGVYSGFMHRVYIVWDRMSRSQSWIQRGWLLRKTGYPWIAWRLLARLRKGIPIVMVLPGGLPQNARLLYAAREFVQHLPVRRWPYSKRAAQRKWMDVLARPVGTTLPCEEGRLPDLTRAELMGLLVEWGFSLADAERWLDLFTREFQLAVPYRTRLFRLLFRRLAAKGKPVLWVAVAHRESSPFVRISAPWAAFRSRTGQLLLLRSPAGTPEALADPAQVAMDFSKEFIV